jgi:polyketide cyclase/dehydrase/lipid transport protein
MWYMSRTQSIDVRAVAPVPPAAVWADLVDGSTWPAWSPLGSYELVSPGSTGPDAPRGEVRTFRTKQAIGETAPREEVVEVVPEQRLSYVLLGGMPLDGYRADIDLTPVEGGTEIRWRSSFTARRPWMGPVYRRMLGVFIQRCADGLAAKHRGQGADPAASATEPATP